MTHVERLTRKHPAMAFIGASVACTIMTGAIVFKFLHEYSKGGIEI